MPISCSAQAHSSSRAHPRRRWAAPRRTGGGDLRDAVGLRDVDAEAALQLLRRRLADVVAARLRTGRTPPLVEVEDHALAQRTARRHQCLDAELGRQRVEDREAAADHRPAVVLQAGEVELVDAAGLEAALDQPAQPVGLDAAVADLVGLEQPARPRRRCRTSRAPRPSGAR
jgi:hypothetical protein